MQLKKCRDTIVTIIIVFTAVALTGCFKHECTPGEWIVTRNATYLQDGEKIRFCTACDEPVEVLTICLSSYVQDEEFVFTPNEFTAKINEKLQDVEGNYGAYIGIRDEDNVVASCIFRNSESSGVCSILYTNDDNSFTGTASKDKIGVDNIAAVFNKSCTEDELNKLLPAIIHSVNPSKTELEARELAGLIIEKSKGDETSKPVVSDGDIQYVLIDVSYIDIKGWDSKWWFYVMVDD